MESVSGMQTFKCEDGNAYMWNKAVQSDTVSKHTTFQNRKRNIQHAV